MRVLWTHQALKGLAHAYDYVAETIPASAGIMVSRIKSAVAALSRFPEMGRLGRVHGTRELVIPKTPFIIAYRVRLQQLEMIAVIHSSQKWPDEL